jgi:predicted solute-binding protein
MFAVFRFWAVNLYVVVTPWLMSLTLKAMLDAFAILSEGGVLGLVEGVVVLPLLFCKTRANALAATIIATKASATTMIALLTIIVTKHKDLATNREIYYPLYIREERLA